MQTFVKLRPLSRLSYLNFTPAEGVELKVAQSNYCLEVKAPVIELEGKAVTEILPNQSFRVTLGKVTPRKYTATVSFPIQLSVNVQGLPGLIMVEPDEEVEITLNLKALRKINLAELPYFMRLYLID